MELKVIHNTVNDESKYYIDKYQVPKDEYYDRLKEQEALGKQQNSFLTVSEGSNYIHTSSLT